MQGGGIDPNATITQKPGVTLADIIDCLRMEAYAAEVSASVHTKNGNAPLGNSADKRARCLDAARNIIEAMLPEWEAHKSMIMRARRSR